MSRSSGKGSASKKRKSPSSALSDEEEDKSDDSGTERADSPSGEDDEDVTDTSPHLLSRSSLSSASRGSVSAPKTASGPLHDELKVLIDTKTFAHSNPVKWFTMARLTQKAQDIAALCNQPGPDQYTTELSPLLANVVV